MIVNTPVYIRVTKEGATIKFELMADGMKICDLTRGQIADMVAQFASSLRWA